MSNSPIMWNVEIFTLSEIFIYVSKVPKVYESFIAGAITVMTDKDTNIYFFLKWYEPNELLDIIVMASAKCF